MFVPDFSFEKIIWKKKKLAVGLDEVGRGALAGPVVAGAVIWPKLEREKKEEILLTGIDDSKRLRPQQRQNLDRFIKQNCLAWGIGQSSVGEINRLGIVKAVQKAMRKAVSEAKANLEKRQSLFLLVDAFHIKYVPGIRLKSQKAIIKGDQRSISIAAASIVAKVYRDKLMTELSSKYQKYGWERNKGYGTEEHRQAIRKFGLNCWHRKQYCAKFATGAERKP
jgi:ribonuclease HII